MYVHATGVSLAIVRIYQFLFNLLFRPMICVLVLTIGTWSNHHRNIIISIHKNISRHLGISFNYFFSPEPIAHCAKSNDTPVKKDASLKNCCLPSILNSKLHLLLASFLVVVVHTTSPFFPRQIYRSHAKHARNRDWGTGKAHIFCSLKHFFGACCTL